MTGHEYSELITDYLLYRYQNREIEIYREVFAGKTIIGKNRRVDILILQPKTNRAFVIECKYQGSTGTVDEKIPYALQDLEAMPMEGCIAYAGEGFSDGVLHMLKASEKAAFCLPEAPDYVSGKNTRELDHLLAMHFNWWDVIVGDKKPEVLKKSNPNLFL